MGRVNRRRPGDRTRADESEGGIRDSVRETWLGGRDFPPGEIADPPINAASSATPLERDYERDKAGRERP